MRDLTIKGLARRLSNWKLVGKREVVYYCSIMQYFESWYFLRIDTLPYLPFYTARYCNLVTRWSFVNRKLFFLKKIFALYRTYTISYNGIFICNYTGILYIMDVKHVSSYENYLLKNWAFQTYDKTVDL